MTAESDAGAAGSVERAVAAAHEATFKALTRYERVPFRRVLAGLLDCAPTPEAIRAFAAKSPDRWAQAVSIMAGLAGFDRGIGPQINVYNVEGLSDAQLAGRIAELDRLLRAKDVTPSGGSAAQSLPPAADAQAIGGATEPPQDAGFVAPNVGSCAEVPTSAAASGGPSLPVGPGFEKPKEPAEATAADFIESTAKRVLP